MLGAVFIDWYAGGSIYILACWVLVDCGRHVLDIVASLPSKHAAGPCGRHAAGHVVDMW